MRYFLFLLLFTSTITFSQYTVEATFVPNVKSDWAILYKVVGAKKNYINNAKIVKDTLLIEGEKQVVGKVTFTLPEDTKPGAYRLTYKLKGGGFADFIFNKENISFALHPDYPEQTIVFSESKENILYQSYLNEIAYTQQQLDSIQITAIKNPSVNQEETYKKALLRVKNIQNLYIEASNGKYVQPFIIATSRANSTNVVSTGQEYMETLTTTFFDNMDFKNETLLNSSFLVDRFVDYIFYINIANDEKTQQLLYKKSIKTVLSKIESKAFQRDVIEFIIKQFAERKNVAMVDYLFEDFYDQLPEALQNKKFKNEQLKELVTEVGRKAPDFSWEENGEKMSLSTLGTSKYYVLVFWSTSCSHCLNEIPKLHTFLKDKPNLKVVAFSLENNDITWKKMKETLQGWHHVLGLKKWENEIARTYNINATPTYFVLDSDKNIIATPEHFSDVTDYINGM